MEAAATYDENAFLTVALLRLGLAVLVAGVFLIWELINGVAINLV